MKRAVLITMILTFVGEPISPQKLTQPMVYGLKFANIVILSTLKRQIVRFREWMVAHGYTNTPVSLSEYGILSPDWFRGIGADFSPEAVNRFMTETFDYILTTTDPELGYKPDGDRLIQEFSWYSVNDDYN